MINHITYLWNNIKNGCCPPEGGNPQPTMRNPRDALQNPEGAFVVVHVSQNEDLDDVSSLGSHQEDDQSTKKYKSLPIDIKKMEDNPTPFPFRGLPRTHSNHELGNDMVYDDNYFKVMSNNTKLSKEECKEYFHRSSNGLGEKIIAYKLRQMKNNDEKIKKLRMNTSECTTPEIEAQKKEKKETKAALIKILNMKEPDPNSIS